MRHITGSCHCANVRFELVMPLDDAPIPVRACGCSFCAKHRGAWTSHPEGRLKAHIADRGEVGLYRFGHGTADFYICRRCGVAPFVVSETEANGERRQRAVVNVNCFDNVPPGDLVVAATDFEHETVEERLSRRGRNWIADVSID